MKDLIRQTIAESGKMRVADVVSYVMAKMPNANKKEVTAQAKELIAEAKKYM